MKKIIITSAALAAIMFGTTALTANEAADASKSALADSVAKKEKEALANPEMTKGEHAAKAKVEEEREKRNFDTKMDKEKFSKEAKADEKKTAD
jgi:hypothetical protein